jgi:hypothetical protein
VTGMINEQSGIHFLRINSLASGDQLARNKYVSEVAARFREDS